MVKTLDDIDSCSSKIDHLEELGIPEQAIRDLRAWLDDEEKRLLESGQKREGTPLYLRVHDA